MTTYLIFPLLSGLLLGIGVLLLKGVFFRMSRRTLSLLDVMLDNQLEDNVKQSLLIKRLGALLAALFLFIAAVLATLVVAALPLLFYSDFSWLAFEADHFKGWSFWLWFTLGTLLPFILLSFRPAKGDYSDFSKLLHQLILDNYNLSLLLFKRERKRILKRQPETAPEEFVVVSGLARCGTTVMTTKLFSSGQFHSLSYANLPFLLSPNTWRRLVPQRKAEQKERAHGDKVMVGVNSVEALEEYFFKASLRDRYIASDHLASHRLSPEEYQNYLAYQLMVRQAQDEAGATYLAKNNNFLLRYESLREHNDRFWAIFMVREPLDHAYSLLKQHRRFKKQQAEDPFVLEYMNWLGHHEFGNNHLPFHFDERSFNSVHSPEDINYWLEIWLNYYQKLASLPPHPRHLIVDYQDFLNSPGELFKAMSDTTRLDLSGIALKRFENTNHYQGDYDAGLLQKAQEVYRQLQARRLQLGVGSAADKVSK